MNAPDLLAAWTAGCALADIPVLGARRVRRPDGVEIAVFRAEADRVYALLDRCPHKGGPLSQGIVLGDAGPGPRHTGTHPRADGRAREPDEGCTPTFAVKVKAGQVWLRHDELLAPITAMRPAHCDGAACADS